MSEYVHDKPLAGDGLISYRYRCLYGFVMIGATDNDHALREAARCSSQKVSMDHLEIWNGTEYVPVKASQP